MSDNPDIDDQEGMEIPAPAKVEWNEADSARLHVRSLEIQLQDARQQIKELSNKNRELEFKLKKFAFAMYDARLVLATIDYAELNKLVRFEAVADGDWEENKRAEEDAKERRKGYFR